MIELSLNEVEGLAAKVGRGAGYSWGLAEDISRAARALAASGSPWAEALLLLAETCAGFSPSFAEGPRCPLRTAAWLNDDPTWAAPLSLSRIGAPLWLAGGLAGSERELVVAWPGASIAINGSVLALSGEGGLAAVADVEVAHGGTREFPPPLRRALVHEGVLAALGAIAERVYVPASETSRARGAGGGSVDDE